MGVKNLANFVRYFALLQYDFLKYITNFYEKIDIFFVVFLIFNETKILSTGYIEIVSLIY